MPKQDTKLESEGAEFLVLGHLLVEGIQAYKMYTNMPGYDVLAVNPNAKINRMARISVKSRWRADAHGFLIKSLDCDFVVVAKLNKGTAKPIPAEFFVMPVTALIPLPRPGWGRVSFSAVKNLHSYLNGWHLIREFLRIETPPEPVDEDETDE